MPQIPSINFWGGPGGPTSERGAESAVPHARAILDEHKRVMVFITHNTDVGDSFEREGDSRRVLPGILGSRIRARRQRAPLRIDPLSGHRRAF